MLLAVSIDLCKGITENDGCDLLDMVLSVVLLEELDEVVVMTGDEVLDVELVLETVELVTVELVEGLGGSAAHGWLDSKSVAT